MQLTGLQHLCLHKVELWDPHKPYYGVVLTLPDACWGSLRHLTHLQVTCRQQFMSRDALQHLTLLSKLQHLNLGCKGSPGQLSSCLSWLLPLTSLTALGLQSAGRLSIPAPGFVALPNLQCLTLIDCSAKPEVLAGITGLQHLLLSRFGLDNGFVVLEDGFGQGAENVGTLLSRNRQDAFYAWLQLQPLTSLSIQYCSQLCTSAARTPATIEATSRGCQQQGAPQSQPARPCESSPAAHLG